MSGVLAVGDAWVQHAIRLVRNRRYRQTQGALIVSGRKIIAELAGPPPYAVAMTPDYLQRVRQERTDAFAGTRCRVISPDALRAVTREPAPEGIIAEIQLPEVARVGERQPTGSVARVLVLYRIADPGNLGTLVRTAAAFGWDWIVLVGECVDPFNFDCVRAAKGLSLRVRISTCSPDQLDAFLVAHRLCSVVADCRVAGSFQMELGNVVLSAGGTDGKGGATAPIRRGIALILGSEAHGLTDFPPAVLNSSVRVALRSSAESLNVGVCGGILMHVLARPSHLFGVGRVEEGEQPIFADLFRVLSGGT